MYPNYIEDRRALGYEALIDTKCSKSLALITDSTVLFVKNVSLNGSYRGERAIIVHNEINGEVLIFRADTKQLWTPSQLRTGQMKRYLETGAIGKQGSVCPTGTTPPPKTT